MVGKIACFVLLCLVVVAPHAEALSCGQVTTSLAPCVPYLQGRGPLGSCCGGVKGVVSAVKTPADRRTACTCLKSAANSVKGLDAGRVAGLPAACGVSIPYKISPSTDCSNIISADKCEEHCTYRDCNLQGPVRLMKADQFFTMHTIWK
ncbi:tyrosine protein phosphatase [Datura stramonium]|uniref:Non-specific lipid-transfer protein n=1 Tax=Datura stramonium TaxID=4076 RepID=A0ABS8WQ62_DATST|nr:tyrosine protein phosphatase [Datura stramonium]